MHFYYRKNKKHKKTKRGRERNIEIGGKRERGRKRVGKSYRERRKNNEREKRATKQNRIKFITEFFYKYTKYFVYICLLEQSVEKYDNILNIKCVI